MKKIALLLAATIVAVALSSCGGTAPEPVDVSDEMTDDERAAILTQQYFSEVELNRFTFGNKEASLAQVRGVKNLIESVFEDPTFVELNERGYKVYVVGHGCVYGGHAANIAMGQKRAAQVAYELRAVGVDYSKLGRKSAGSTQPKPDLDPGRWEQRRVTFEVARR